MRNRAGELPKQTDLIDINAVLTAYYNLLPDINKSSQKVSFGTSGHRGSSEDSSFNETHIIAITQAIIEYRKSANITGKCFVGFDTHLLSLPTFRTVLSVLAAADIDYVIDIHITTELLDLAEKGVAPNGCAIWTPTPVVSHAILGNGSNADGIIITPSHNPPSEGGIKYNPPHGGPADSDVTKIIETRANELITISIDNIPRQDFATALKRAKRYDFRTEYINDLANIIDMDAISASGVRIGADPMGGATVDYWSEISKMYKLNLTTINTSVDPKFSFIALDHDEKIRMDCSSPNAMNGLLSSAATSGEYDILTGNDADADRHGIVIANSNNPILMNPNHYLAAAISYLFGGARPDWSKSTKVGKTLVSSSLIDRIVRGLGRQLYEVPVGFKWFVPGLFDGSLGFGGEESAGASFLRKNGKVWTTDKDGIIMCLLAAEIIAKTGKTPVQIYDDLTRQYGQSWYERDDVSATIEQKVKLSKLSPEQITDDELAGEEITEKITTAPSNHASIGGLKVSTQNAWFAARPSGTENIYKIYAESFKSAEHLSEVKAAAKAIVDKAIE